MISGRATMSKRALITGITGQDGSYLAELLLEKGYEVYGLRRRTSTDNGERIAHIRDRITFVDGDLLDEGSLVAALTEVRPHEVYNLAAQSFVPTSFTQPIYTSEVNGLGPIRLLEAIRQVDKSIRFYQASTSEMFGRVRETPQNELTPFHPRSPYGASKALAHYATVNYREAHDMFAVSGILFNHESPRRGEEFVTRKISMQVAKVRLGLADRVTLGNTFAQRDWGFAGDYVRAMWLMLQAVEPDDYVVATGITHTVRDFYMAAMNHADLDWQARLTVDPKLIRPAEVDILQGDTCKIKNKLGWVPTTTFKELVGMMVDADIERLKNARKTSI